MSPENAERAERVADGDRLLIVRMEADKLALLRAAAEVEATVGRHLTARYGLRPGDRIEDDGRITRAATAAAQDPA